MAKKKVYAVRKGLQTGIFHTWAECEAVVKEYSGAEYKSFSTEAEALAYLQGGQADVAEAVLGDSFVYEFPVQEDTLTAYVDGSYHDGIKTYAFGCVFLLPDGRTLTYFGNGTEPDSLAMRNVAGEMLGAMYAVQFALKNGYQHIDICYDYAGIEQWATGGWKTNKELTKKYATFMQKQGHFIDIRFHKVEAHANVTYNEMADQLAKQGLTEGKGIPEIERVVCG